MLSKRKFNKGIYAQSKLLEPVINFQKKIKRASKIQAKTIK